MNTPAPHDPVSAAFDAEARAIVARIAMIDARDLANRARAHALELREKVGGPHAETAAETFDRQADQFRELEMTYSRAAGEI